MNDRRPRLGHFLTSAALIGACCAPALATAVEPAQEIAELRAMLEEASKQLAAQRRALTEQETALAAQKRELDEQKRILETLQARMRQPAMQIVGLSPASGRGEPPRADAEKPLNVAAAEPQTEAPVGRAPEAEPARPSQVDLTGTRGVLTPQNSWTLEPSLTYAHSSNNRVSILGFTILPALTIGVIDIRKLNHDSFVGALAGRYGITNRLEFEARAPYAWSKDTTESRPYGAGSSVANTINDTSGSGIGDVELALRYQLNEGGLERPYYIGNLRVKTRTGKGSLEVPTDANGFPTELPTGSGFWGVQPSITAIFPTDPAVFFGNISYMWNIKRNIGNYGEVDPGDVFGINFGMGLALNDKASFSIGYDHSVIAKTVTAPGSILQPSPTKTQVGILSLGYSYRLNEKSSINLTLGAGLTEAAPDMQLTLRYPMSF